MAYGRDPDRHTRGAGAIAARDNANPAAARARRRVKNARTVAHDRVMRTMTYGPKGGMSSLGALNLGYQGGSGGALRQQDIGFEIGTGRTPKPPSGPSGGSPTISSWTTRGLEQLARPSLATLQTTPRMTLPTDQATPPPVDPGSGWTPQPTTPPPTKTGGTTTRPKKPSSPVVGGGGGGAPWIPPKPVPLPMPDGVELPDVHEGGSKFNAKTAVLVGAAALAAYLLLRKKKGSAPP